MVPHRAAPLTMSAAVSPRPAAPSARASERSVSAHSASMTGSKET